MAARREGWTMEWFSDPQQADAKDRAMYRQMTPQQRLDAMLDLMTRWGHVCELPFHPVMEIVEVADDKRAEPNDSEASLPPP